MAPAQNAPAPKRADLLPLRGRFVWLAALILSCTLCPASLSAPAAPADPPAREASSANLLTNGDFRVQPDDWVLERTPGTARAGLEWLPSQAPPGVAGGTVRVNVSAVGSEPWHVQLYQGGLTLKEGEIYTLSFWSRADRNRPLRVAANVTQGDGHGIGLAAEHLTLDREWRKFRLAFTAGGTVTQRCRVTFVLGSALGSVDLAGITLRQGMPGSAAGGNLLKNGGFGANDRNWVLEQGGGGSRAQMEIEAETGVAGRVARISTQQLGTEPWHIQLVQPGLDLRENEPYLLTFWARAEAPRSISVATTIDMPDWHSVGLTSDVRLTREWQPYRLAFTANGTVAGHGRLAVVLGQSAGEVALHSFSLRHYQAEPPPPAPHPVIGTWVTRSSGSERITFTFNADGTGSLRLMPDQAAPTSPAPNPFRWYIQGSELVLAGRRHSWSVEGQGQQRKLTLKAPGGRTYVLYRSTAPR